MDHEDRHGYQAHPEVELRLHQDGLCWREVLWSARSTLIDCFGCLLFLEVLLGSPHLLRFIAFPPHS
jgi:hypothetical protein